MLNTRVSTVIARKGRVVIGRILRDTDLVTGIIELCRQTGIVTGAIEIAIGSLRKADISWAIPSDKTRRGSERTAPVPIEGPLEFITGQGLVCLADLDRPVIHFHGMICDPNGRAWGGHFFPNGNPVHSTMDVVITEIEGARMDWELDPEIDLELPVPRHS
ncbi:MAG: PPC domain-containing DNA-binding protein [Thermodesulfobacteriota bacterium]